MSNTSPVINGENTGGVTDFTSDASVNMVAAIHDHITCSKPVSVDAFNSQDTKAGIMTYSCAFDHMYASLDEGTTLRKDAEVKHLKELLLLHLDLIQQQSEQLVTKDKQLSALRQENETLRQRLERMDRRVTLQKHRDMPEAYAVGCTSPSALSPAFAVPLPFCPAADVDMDTLTLPLEPLDSSLMSLVAPVQLAEPRAWDGGAKRRASTTPVGERRKRLASWTSSVNSDGAASQDGRSSTPMVRRGRGQKKNRMKGATAKKEMILTTDVPYYTPVGDPDSTWGTEELDTNTVTTSPEVQVPSWRIKVYTSCYSMEGTENLDEDVFNKRHQRLEIDERRRKRWDVQRIREQRQIEKLKQREEASSRRNSSSARHSDEEPLTSLWPQAEDAEYLEVTNQLPVVAFGLPITMFTSSEFSLPWQTVARCKTTSSQHGHSARRRLEGKR